MTNLSYEAIQAIIAKYQKQAPVNVEGLSAELKITIHRELGWPDKLCGKIVKDSSQIEGSGYSIYLNGAHHVNRQRFTLAHEIAHYILHKDSIGDGIADDALYRSGLSDAKEFMANKLAAEILMPSKLVNIKIREGLDTVEKLAEAFNVSVSAMAIKLGIPS